MTTRKYYTLFGKVSKRTTWEQIFGDYDRQTVREEYVDNVDHFPIMRIVAHDDTTEAMFAELGKLNGI